MQIRLDGGVGIAAAASGGDAVEGWALRYHAPDSVIVQS